MKLSNIITLSLSAAAIAAPSPDNIDSRANLPGLNALQSKYANAIIAQAKKDGVGPHGCQAAIATAMVEVRPHKLPIIRNTNARTDQHHHVRQQRSPTVAELSARSCWFRPRQHRAVPAPCVRVQEHCV
ncbi:hypothetical protein VFPPC_17490 [Pochonia chlamydosporia 170]|uniref:Uncharacterized protein n=1 Tax=Pochonia chlamydosporia 170 TaxID=1380566 RepID=A0A219ARD8_METCM|nr:hypothetical protein VFPPC_17490 [Pochonia chlamydosporia 170]OWT43347.1 hypothetical protein VFPPC_17490 [Pochonia chlamydosporia 170]